MPTNITTRASDIPAEVNVFYDEVALTRALPMMLHAAFGQRRKLKPNAGTDTIKFRRYASLNAATTPLTEGTTPDGQKLSVTDLTAQVNQYGDFVEITDRVSTESIDPVLVEIAEVLGEQQGDTNDKLTRAVISAGTTVQYADGVASRGDVSAANKLDEDEFDKAVRTLGTANARKVTGFSSISPGQGTIPIPPCYVAIISEKAAYDVRKLSGFIPVEKYAANTPLLPGEIGKVGLVRLCETTSAKVFSGAGDNGIDVHAAIVLGADAYGVIDLGNSQASGVIFKALGSAGSADPLNQRQTLGWKEYFTTKILNDAFMVRIEHAVSS